MGKYTALIILNYNNYQDTINCISSIIKYNTAPIKIIIVDNYSTNVNAIECLNSYLESEFKEDYSSYEISQPVNYPLTAATLIKNDVNSGYARGNNIGLNVAYSDKDIDKVVIMNNDVLFTSDILGQLCGIYDTLDNPGFVTPLLFKKDGKSYDYGCARLNHSNADILITALLFDKPWFGIKKRISEKRFILLNNPNCIQDRFVEIELPVGAFMLISKELMHQIGDFDPNTFLYYEENILYKKLSRVGKKNYLIPSLSCIHIGAASTSTNSPAYNSPSIRSLDYYVSNYSGMNIIQRIVFKICINIFKFLKHIK